MSLSGRITTANVEYILLYIVVYILAVLCRSQKESIYGAAELCNEYF